MKAKILFFPLSIVLALVIFIWMTKPAWEEHKLKKAELENLRKEKQEFQKGLSSLKNARSDYDVLDDETRNLINAAIPTDRNDDDLVGEIHRNSLQSGVYISGISLSEEKDIQSECEKENNEKKKKDGAAAYCPPVKISVQADIEVIGEYYRIKDFFKKLETQNRLTSLIDYDIEKGDSVNAPEDTPERESTLVQAKTSFKIFNKTKDDQVKLSKLSSSDAVLKSLLKGSINMNAIEMFKDEITKEHFYPVTSEGVGKLDLFL